MDFLKISVVLFVCFAVTYSQQQTCQENEVFVLTSCGNRCSQPHCPNLPAKPCAYICNANGGCDCMPGYIRNASDACILQSQCCGPNEENVNCPNPCPLTCDQPTPGPCSKMCIRQGCQCKQGYVKNSNGQCITPDQCQAPVPSSDGQNMCDVCDIIA